MRSPDPHEHAAHGHAEHHHDHPPGTDARVLWTGLALLVVGAVATLVLAWTGQLGLYIHPRYFVFTTVLASVALAGVIAAVPVLVRRVGAPRPDRRAVPAAVLVLVTAVALLIVPPAALTSATAEQRQVNAALTGDASEVSADAAERTVADWALLLRQGVDTTGESVSLTGFVTEDADDPKGVILVTRFVVTCCAVDAQPVGVPVALPGWSDELAVGDWVRIDGVFGPNPSLTSLAPSVVLPNTVEEVAEPREPYL